MLFDDHPPTGELGQTYMADLYGFSFHAAVRCGANDRQALEHLCRYITRPALANERVQTNAAEQVVVKLKIAWRNGTTHLEMSPLEFTPIKVIVVNQKAAKRRSLLNGFCKRRSPRQLKHCDAERD